MSRKILEASSHTRIPQNGRQAPQPNTPSSLTPWLLRDDPCTFMAALTRHLNGRWRHTQGDGRPALQPTTPV